MKSILIVDDDVHIGNMLEELLTKEGYAVSRAYSGTEAVLILSNSKPDLILLDLMLPGLGGEDVLTKIEDIPVIVVSAKIDVADKVKLLLGGAADYITKPFDTKELLARITVQLRDRKPCGASSELIFDDIVLDAASGNVTVSGEEVHLTRTEGAILKILMQNRGRIITKAQLMEQIAAFTPDCTESSLKIHVWNLKKKLKAISDKEYIESVWGIGFKMKTE